MGNQLLSRLCKIFTAGVRNVNTKKCVYPRQFVSFCYTCCLYLSKIYYFLIFVGLNFSVFMNVIFFILNNSQKKPNKYIMRFSLQNIYYIIHFFQCERIYPKNILLYTYTNTVYYVFLITHFLIILIVLINVCLRTCFNHVTSD